MKKLIILLVMIVLFINFTFFWLSVWPYSKPLLLLDGKYVTDTYAVNGNFIKYLTLNFLTMVIGITCHIKLKCKNI